MTEQRVASCYMRQGGSVHQTGLEDDEADEGPHTTFYTLRLVLRVFLDLFRATLVDVAGRVAALRAGGYFK